MLADFSPISFAPVAGGAGHSAFSFTNKSSAALALQVRVHGAQGVRATFQQTGLTSMKVAPGAQATISLVSNPLYAGSISGSLEISAKGLQSLMVPISGSQAPLAPGAVTATPVAKGAVDLSWAPSGSVSGVAGYIVERGAAGRHAPADQPAHDMRRRSSIRRPPTAPTPTRSSPSPPAAPPPRARPGRPHPRLRTRRRPRRRPGWHLPDFINGQLHERAGGSAASAQLPGE